MIGHHYDGSILPHLCLYWCLSRALFIGSRYILHVGVTVLRTLSAMSFFPSDNFFYIFKKLKRIICTIFLSNKKYRSPCLFKRKGALFHYRAYFEGNLGSFVSARAHVRIDCHRLISRALQHCLSLKFTLVTNQPICVVW